MREPFVFDFFCSFFLRNVWAVSQVRAFLNWEWLVFYTSTKPVLSKTDKSLVVFVWPNQEKCNMIHRLEICSNCLYIITYSYSTKQFLVPTSSDKIVMSLENIQTRILGD
jgi:hypothetical protein